MAKKTKKKRGQKKKSGRGRKYDEGQHHNDFHKTVHVPNSTKARLNKVKRTGENFGEIITLALNVVDAVGLELLGMKNPHPQDVLDALHDIERKKRKKDEGGK